MSSLMDSLKHEYPQEHINAFGKCLVIPSKAFLPEWEEQLKRQDYKTFMQARNGETCVFIRLEKSVTVEKPEKRTSAFPRRWTEREVEQLKELVGIGLKPSEIASKLDRSRFSVLGKMQRMNFTQPEPTSMLEPIASSNPTLGFESQEPTVSIGDDVIKEFLGACSLLYPTYKTACAYLLREASNKILGETE